jgi:cytoskeletal protein CcmA (bactofilin family)
MFKNNNKQNQNMSTGPNEINRIVEGTKFKGELECASSIRVDGSLEGSLNTVGKLVVGASGIVEGDVYCDSADVEGQILGTLNVKNRLFLKSTADIKGDIVFDKLVVEDGAKFRGQVSMQSEKSVSKVAQEQP